MNLRCAGFCGGRELKLKKEELLFWSAVQRLTEKLPSGDYVGIAFLVHPNECYIYRE